MEQDNFTDDFFYGTCIPILNLLAKRFDPNTLDTGWCRRLLSTNETIKYSCRICCEEFLGKLNYDKEFNDFINRVKRHGFLHIKERNLLPFA